MSEQINNCLGAQVSGDVFVRLNVRVCTRHSTDSSVCHDSVCVRLDDRVPTTVHPDVCVNTRHFIMSFSFQHFKLFAT